LPPAQSTLVVPVPAFCTLQPPPLQLKVTVPVPVTFKLQPPSSQVKVESPAPLAEKEHPASTQLYSQDPAASHTHLSPLAQSVSLPPQATKPANEITVMPNNNFDIFSLLKMATATAAHS